eukprot:COSAG06_NODE_5731_length_3302_cov_57.733999_2_plen_71_part_00
MRRSGPGEAHDSGVGLALRLRPELLAGGSRRWHRVKASFLRGLASLRAACFSNTSYIHTNKQPAPASPGL